MDGTVFREILRSIQEEAEIDAATWAPFAEQIRGNMLNRTEGFAAEQYPYGSEFAFDTTGQEEVVVWLMYFADTSSPRSASYAAAAKRTVDHVLSYMRSSPTFAYHGGARSWGDLGNNGKWFVSAGAHFQTRGNFHCKDPPHNTNTTPPSLDPPLPPYHLWLAHLTQLPRPRLPALRFALFGKPEDLGRVSPLGIRLMHSLAGAPWGCLVHTCFSLYLGAFSSLMPQRTLVDRSGLNSIPLLEWYRRNPDDFTLLEIAAGAIAGQMNNIDETGAGSMMMHMEPHILDFDPHSGDFGLGYFGTMVVVAPFRSVLW